MITVQDDWVTYETVPVRPVVVRGGAACAQRTRVVTERRPAPEPRPASATAVAPRPAAARPASAAAARVRSASTPIPAAPKRRLRLTRRGRLVLVVVPAVLGVTAALVSVTAPLAEAQPTRADRVLVVGTGDTLWSVAERVAPAADPRDVVAELERANHLGSAAVRAGQRLVLPAGVTG